MLNLKKMQTMEVRSDEASARSATLRVIVLFIIVVLGILASWFWVVGWEYLADPTKGLILGPGLAILVRVVLSFIAAAVSFSTMYSKINQNTQDSWIPYFLAFQNGFFWDAIFQGISQAFTGNP